jgi:hypothetical protein
MMKKLSMPLVILILIASTLSIIPVKSLDSGSFKLIEAYWGTDQKIQVSPGDFETLTVIIRYDVSRSTIRNLEAYLFLPEGFEPIGDRDSVLVYYSGSISEGSFVKLEFPIFITPEAEKGNYTADLYLYYSGYYPEPGDELKIPFGVTGKPSITIDVPDGGIHEGRQETSIRLINEGDAAAKNLRVTEVYSTSATIDPDNEDVLGVLEPGNSVTVPLNVFVSAGMKGKALPITVELSYLGPENVLYELSQSLQIPVKSTTLMPPLTLDVDSEELSIGKSTIVNIDLKNVADRNLSEIQLTLSPDNTLKLLGSTVFYIDTLLPGENRSLEIEAYVPTTTAALTASLTTILTYFDEGTWSSYSETQQINMLLRGLIEISLTDFAIIPNTPRPENPFSITFTVTNIGTSKAYAASTVPYLEGLPASTFGPKSVYIGDIEMNLPTTFTVNLQLESTTMTSMVLPVTLSYMDNLRSLHYVTFNVTVSIDQTSEPVEPSTSGGRATLFGLPILVWTAVAIVAIAAVIIWYKKR